MNVSQTWWTRVGNNSKEGLRVLLLLLLGAYRTIGTTHLGGSCRFMPSCSEYALEATRTHPPLKAIRLIGIRICRCRPGGPWGFDPVPPASLTQVTLKASQEFSV